MNLKPLTRVGLFGTAVWVVAIVAYTALVGVEKFKSLEPNSVGDFVAGATAPLAFWWLVLGYFQQGIELRQNVEALQRQSEETANLVRQAEFQANAIKANELHARRDTFYRIAAIEIDELDRIICSFLYREGRGWNISHSYERVANGDGAFVRYRFLEEIAKAPELYVVNNNSKKFQQNYKVYISKFEALLHMAHIVEDDEASLRYIEHSGVGDVYAALCLANNKSPVFMNRSIPTSYPQV